MKKKVLFLFFILTITLNQSLANEGLRTMFLNSSAIICGINIRNFNSADFNQNGMIDENEERGNFINAIDRLDEIRSLGINTLHVLPITPTGKLKALGTAGSLYAISSFDEINEQIIDKNSHLNGYEQLKLFIDECHKRGIYVMIDLPSCGSYDLFLKNPKLFIKDNKRLSVVPTDWTDVRLLNTGDNKKLNQDLIDIHKKFVDMILSAGADGIRADVATIKPQKFWEEIIKYARSKNPEFLFLAEASDSWREPPSSYAQFTPYDKLLEAGFDGYYGSFFNLKEWKKSEDLIEHVKFNKKLLSSYEEAKSVILSFTTHDELSPVLINGETFSKMICWLEGTLPFNPYIIDGFQTGDEYIYQVANTKALNTETDDDYYFVHRGKLDIFNFSRKPEGNFKEIENEYKNAMKFRESHKDLITLGDFIPLKTNNEKIFAFARCYEGETIIVVGNLDFENTYKKTEVKISGLNQKHEISSINGKDITKIRRGKMFCDINAGEIMVLHIDKFSI